MIIFVSGCAGSSALSSEVGESSTPEQSLGATETAGRDPTEALPAHTPQPPSIPASATLAPTTETPTVTLPVVIESATPTIAQQVLAPNADVEPAIARIRQQFAAINQELEQYRTVERPLVGFSTEGGTLTGYFAGPSLRKMAASYFGESGRADEECYFWDDRLFFVFRTQ